MASLHMDLHSDSLLLKNFIREHFLPGITVIFSAARIFMQKDT